MAMEQVDYQSIIRAAPDRYLIVSPDLKIIDASDAYLKTTKVNREEILGRLVVDVFPDKSYSSENILNYFKGMLKGKSLVNKKHADCIKDKGALEIFSKNPFNVPVFNDQQEMKYIIHRIEDESELEGLKQIALESSSRFQALVEHIDDYAMMMLDTEGRFLTWNSGAELILGYEPEEVEKNHFSILYPKEAKFHSKYVLKAAEENGRYEEQGWRVRQNGSKFWAGILITPIYVQSSYDQKNHLIGFGKMLRDLTIQKQIDNVKNEFVSVVNHELRTPLTTIFGAIRLLVNWPHIPPEKHDNLLKVANDNCDKLLTLINDILEVGNLDLVEGMSLHFQNVALNVLIANAVSLKEEFSARKGIKVHFTGLKEDVSVRVDVCRFIQVITHLLSNAIKYAHPNSSVLIKLKKRGSKVRILVINQGVGIPDSFKTRIFDKFSQVDSTTTRSENGMGLGLSLCKQIIERFGSMIKFKSIPNEETTFYFDLPIV